MNKKIHYTLILLLPLLFCLPLNAWSGLPRAAGGQELPTLAPMLKQVTPGVVNIATQGRVVTRSPLLDDPFFQRFFDIPELFRERRTQGLGSGVIVDSDEGYILTNHHVIEKAELITITLKDGRQFEAKLIGTDSETDIAVLQIEADDLTAVPAADSDRLEVGDFVVAIGNPFGLGQTVTSGIISALGRSGLGIESYEDFIQTDASINPGNSGGALVNLRGELVGINTAIHSPSGGNIGIGFAIPVNMARGVMQQLIEHGEVQRGLLGVGTQDLTPELAQVFGIKRKHGAVVALVDPDSPADRAGLKVGDVVVRVNKRPVRNSLDLRNVVGLLRAGSRIELEVIRDGRQRHLTAVITKPQVRQLKGNELNDRLAGTLLGDIGEGSPYYGRINGVQVLKVKPRSPSSRAGLRQGDIILGLNRYPVANLSELEQVIRGSRGGLWLNLFREGSQLYIMIR
ncbi:DegQ family serine endoprotease [Pseudomonadota bacterium]